MRSALAGLMVLASLSAAEAAEVCKFVSVDTPGFTIEIDEWLAPTTTLDGVVTKYASMSGGTGIPTRVAHDLSQENPETIVYMFHEYRGENFLTFGPDLLVEKCAKAK